MTNPLKLSLRLEVKVTAISVGAGQSKIYYEEVMLEERNHSSDNPYLYKRKTQEDNSK